MSVHLFVSSDALPGDSDLFFGTITSNEKVVVFDKTTFTMADMAVSCGFFPSRNQARKNGWPITAVPLGFGSKRSGKNFVFWFNAMDNILE